MPRDLPAACHELLAVQCGVISRGQALGSGVPEAMIGGRLRLGAWQQLHPGVYAARTFEDAFHWLSLACGRRLTTVERLQAAVASRKKVRHRDALLQALAAIAGGAHSNLEHRYVQRVERPHGLPVPHRQAPITIGRGRRYLDNLYREFGVAVELDGQAAHPVEDRWRDLHRDNASAGLGIITLRYSWADVTERPCDAAAEIATVLQQRGWDSRPHPCGARCRITAS